MQLRVVRNEKLKAACGRDAEGELSLSTKDSVERRFSITGPAAEGIIYAWLVELAEPWNASVDLHEERKLTLFGSHLRDIDMEIADGILSEFLFCGPVAFDLGQPADVMALKTAV
jgi:hypothetical protein